MRTTAARLNTPHSFCEGVVTLIPMRKIAREINKKNAREAELCGIPVERGNMPIAENVIEPRTRLTIPKSPSNRPDRRLFHRPIANTRLNIPVKISPELNNVIAEPLTPRTLK
jgi:hypothetical protein